MVKKWRTVMMKYKGYIGAVEYDDENKAVDDYMHGAGKTESNRRSHIQASLMYGFRRNFMNARQLRQNSLECP